MQKLLIALGMLLITASPTLAETLRAGNFRVTITRNCPEGSVTCDDVIYNGINLSNGDSIRLTGTTVHSVCADGVTPCRFIGYEFYNGDYRYFVTEDGRLQVYQGNELLLDQAGTWEPD